MIDFDTPIDRTSSDSHKWQKYKRRDIIPMWVADMDFQSPPEVLQALRQRVDHGIFGYGSPDPELKPTLIDHLFRTYGWTVAPEWIVWLPGLVTGLNVACRSTGRPGAGILTTIPVYPPFLTAPRNAGKKLQTTGLVFVDNMWRVDMDGLQHSIDDKTALFLLCNPHNPTGRVFSRQELETMAETCLRNKLIICSDEIHCDLVLDPDCHHIPMAAISPEVAAKTITLMAPSKTFNIPGLGCSFAVISDPKLRLRFKRAMAGIVPHVNVLGFTAALAAYKHGKPWLAALLDYLRINRDVVFEAVNQMPGLNTGPVQATYLAWIDARMIDNKLPGNFFEKAGVGLSDGTMFGAPGYVRLNFGCPRGLLMAGLDRMSGALKR